MPVYKTFFISEGSHPNLLTRVRVKDCDFDQSKCVSELKYFFEILLYEYAE
jgi:hypothetical protein